MKRIVWIAVALVVVLLAAVSVVWLMPVDHQTGDAPQLSVAADGDVLTRGAALVALGDCRACHTARGGAAFAGGRGKPTPFGIFYAPNITPDAVNRTEEQPSELQSLMRTTSAGFSL